jgi:exodeoxyribonuclease V gamma subunit
MAYGRARGGERLSFVLHRAERADVLADALADILREPLADPFSAEVVAVHSRGIERWLSNRMAGRLGTAPGLADGVCANVHFPFPGRLVGDALAGATGIDAASDPWRPERLAWPLLAVVEANLDEPWLDVLAGHLGGNDATSSDRDRRFAAVRHIADLFDTYAVHRPAMVRSWSEGRDEDGAQLPQPLPIDARWQAELWRRLRAAVGEPSPAERLVAGCVALERDPDLADLPPRFALFGLTRLPSSYLDVLRALAAHRDVHLMALHPSPAAWSTIAAIATTGPPDTAPPLDPEAATNAIRHPLLRAWGRDSREMHLVLADRLARELTAVDRHHPLAEAEPRTLLQRLQHAIRADAPTPDAGDRPTLDAHDRSLQVHACHGRTRQAEVVRDAITHLLADDPTLEPRDIVVMCPDIDELAPLLRAAFQVGSTSAGDVDGGNGSPPRADGDGPPAIPYRLADRSLRQTNPVLGATAEILALVDQRLTASQVLTFAALPPVRQRFGFDDDDLERLAAWVDATGTRWGLDAEHRAPFDLTTVAAGTWDAGITRVLLGVTMSEDDARLIGGVLPLDDVDSGDIDLAGRFAELIGRLQHVVADLSTHRPVTGWVAAIEHAADLLLHTRPVDAWQRGQLDRLLNEVVAEAGDEPGPSLRVAEVRDLLADRLRGQPSRAAFRTGDLTMCTLVPMRSVPHRVVCLVGLDDGAFPRGGTADGDNILERTRHIGDHDRRAEDRQLLLDAVLAASDALIITYAGRDARTNEVLPPAVPVNELLDAIDASIRTDDGRPARSRVVQHHPLQPSNARCFIPSALGTDGPWGFDPNLLDGARAATGPRRPPERFLPQALPPLVEATILLDDLVAFVQHPAKAFLRQRLGLVLGTRDDRPRDGLPIEFDALEAWGVGNRLVNALLAGGDADAVCAAEVARGLLPPGSLGEGVLLTARTKAEAIVDAARALADGRRSSLQIDIGLADGRRLVGSVPDVVGDIVRPASYSKVKAKVRLAAWVRFLAATAAHPDRPIESAVIGGGGRGPLTVRWMPLAATADDRRSNALALLAMLIDLRDHGLREPLPLFCDTSHAFAAARWAGDPDADLAAERCWKSEFNWPKEDREPEHVRVLDGTRTFEEILAIEPTSDEQGDGWAAGEPSRFALLAVRLWDPILAHGKAGSR